jgi:hypothetical protein
MAIDEASSRADSSLSEPLSGFTTIPGSDASSET